jgi:CRP-like cAMP-binding protein
MDNGQLKSDASAALAAGDFARAGNLFASYCAMAPGDRQSLLRMGDAWARAGERARAIDAYLAAAQGFAADGFLARAIAASKLVLELEPGHQRMQRILADLYARRGVGPGVGRRPREVTPPVPAPEPVAPSPPPNAQAAEEAPELVVTEFVLDNPSSERTLEDALAEAVGNHSGAPLTAPPSPGPPPVAPERPPEATQAARFLELSLDETELHLPPAPHAGAPAPPRTPTSSFSLAEPGPPPPPLTPPRLAEAPAAAAGSEEQPSAPAPAAPEEGGYIDLFFEEDEPLEASAASAGEPAAEEPLSEETVAQPRGMAEALASAVPKAPLFSDLSSEAFVELVERCPLRHFAAGERILQQDAPGEAFYVICEGQVAVRREEGGAVLQLAHLTEGDFFGEMALLSGAPRVASVDALVDGTLVLEISTALLSELTRRHPGVATALKKFCRQRLLSNLMATSALFRPLSRADRRLLASSFRARDVLAGDVVLTEGGRGDGL